MSFSSDVKERLCECRNKCENCRRAETAGMLLFGGRVSAGAIHFTTENEKIAKRLDRDIFECIGERVRCEASSGASRFDICADTAVRIAMACEWENGARRCCMSAYARGAFLGSGSVTDPKRSYHLELTTRSAEQLDVLRSALKAGGIEAKVMRRKDAYVAYVKGCERIADVIAYMGAQTAALDMFSIQVEKEVRNGINRRVNCETANTDKLITAASRHLAAVQRIRAAGKWSTLPKTLAEIGELREKYPEMGLKELGEKASPPIGKSGANHRLNRLVKLAEEL